MTMQYVDMVNQVRHQTGVASDRQAADATRAVVETLLACLSLDLANEVAARLPEALRSASGVTDWTPEEHLTLSEFLLRVAQEQGILELTALRYAQAVFPLLAAPLGNDLLARVRAELPIEFDELWTTNLAQVHMHQPVG